MIERIKFITKDEKEKKFAQALKKNVRAYFKERDQSAMGNYRMVIKAITMLTLYLAPLVVILTVDIAGWFALILTFLMGIGLAGIGMAVMHDAAHEVFSEKRWLNKLMARTMFLLGGGVTNWRIQHNIYHHTYTNIYKWDGDIDSKAIIRLSEHAPLKRIQRFQYLYSFLLYGLMTFVKLITDFKQLNDFHKKGMIEALGLNYQKEMLVLIFTKLAYVGVFLVMPFLFTDYALWQILIGFFVMHTVASLIMSTVFQMAHVITETEQPLPSEEGVIENENFVHQLKTTSNFGRTPKFLKWYIGGLNYQVEHHLFPNISHLYYPKIAPIVKSTADEYDMPYHVHPSIYQSFVSHVKALIKLGNGHAVHH